MTVWALLLSDVKEPPSICRLKNSNASELLSPAHPE